MATQRTATPCMLVRIQSPSPTKRDFMIDFIGFLRDKLQDDINDMDPGAAGLGEAYHWDMNEVLIRALRKEWTEFELDQLLQKDLTQNA